MRLMAVMAHPDDAEIWCGGTLILHAQKGDAVRICILSYTPESVRGQEAQEGARRMGCDVEFLGLEDAAIRDTDEAGKKLRKSIDLFQPDTIITHWYDDMHPDHEATFHLVRRVLTYHFLVNSIRDYTDIPRIFCCDTYASFGLRGSFKADKFVDVTDIWSKKIAAINAHQSQPLAFFLEMIGSQCRTQGEAAGTERAEGFLYLPLFGRPDDGEPLGT